MIRQIRRKNPEVGRYSPLMSNNALRSAVFPGSRVNVANRQQPSERHPIRLAAQASTAPRAYGYMVRGGACGCSPHGHVLCRLPKLLA